MSGFDLPFALVTVRIALFLPGKLKTTSGFFWLEILGFPPGIVQAYEVGLFVPDPDNWKLEFWQGVELLVAAVASGSKEEGTKLNCLAIIISPPVDEDEFVALTTA